MHKFSVLRVHLLSFQLARITALAFQVPTLSTIRSKSTSIKHFQRDCRIWLDNYTDSEDKVYKSFESRNSVIGNNSYTEIQARRCLCRGSNIHGISNIWIFYFTMSKCLSYQIKFARDVAYIPVHVSLVANMGYMSHLCRENFDFWDCLFSENINWHFRKKIIKSRS